jgi:hypothetical protein
MWLVMTEKMNDILELLIADERADLNNHINELSSSITPYFQMTLNYCDCC